jgi:hypothetical protein
MKVVRAINNLILINAKLKFNLINILGPPMKEALTSSQKVPIFRLYGVNDAGNSILGNEMHTF